MDGVHNVLNQSYLYVIFYSLSKPDNFGYKINIPDYDDVLVQKFKWNSRRYHKIILDIKSLLLSKLNGAIFYVGWTLLLMFSLDNYLNSNSY